MLIIRNVGRHKVAKLLGLVLTIGLFLHLLSSNNPPCESVSKEALIAELNGTSIVIGGKEYHVDQKPLLSRDRLSGHRYADDILHMHGDQHGHSQRHLPPASGASRHNNMVAPSGVAKPHGGGRPGGARKDMFVYPKVRKAEPHYVVKAEGNRLVINASGDGTFLPKTLLTEAKQTAVKIPWGTIATWCAEHPVVSMPLRELPKTSVIITFIEQEQLSHLLHTVHSIIQRTPPEVLQEIILIDDFSKKDDFKTILENYVRSVFPSKVKLVRAAEHLGLIRARLHGIKIARGEVVVCMDSHMEVQKRWLEPLLYEIRQNPRTLAGSYLDWMEKSESRDKSSYTWTYTVGASTWKTYFDWSFIFGFQDMSEADHARQNHHHIRAVRTPVTIGTIFAINKEFFLDIGGFDEGMQGWGGENLDLPIRVWLFGGQVLNVPCSHTAHYEGAGTRDYRRSWDNQIHHNYKRVAEVWLDDYKKYLYYYHPDIEHIDAGNLTSRFALKKRAKYDFKWFLSNVFPEIGMPDVNTYAFGSIKNVGISKCIEAIPLNNPFISSCVNAPIKQHFFWTMEGLLRFPVHIFNTNQDGQGGYIFSTLEYIPKHKDASNTRWLHWKNGPFIDMKSKQCLTVTPLHEIILSRCDFSSKFQRWSFSQYSPYFMDMFNSYNASPDEQASELDRTIFDAVKYTRSRNWSGLEQYLNDRLTLKSQTDMKPDR